MSLFVRVLDLETTGPRPPDHAIIELGWQDVAARPGTTRDAPGAWEITGERGAVFVAPGRPIPARTSVIHHLIDEDVAGALPWAAASPPVLGVAPAAFAAHRAAFEARWIPRAERGGLPFVCTWKCALRLWPDSESHANQFLRYDRRPAGLDRALALPAHRAGPDAYVTAHHLRDLLAEASLDALLEWSAAPALLARVPYGPSRGRRWREVSDDVLADALARNTDADVRFTARHERARRQAERDGEPELPL